MTTEHTRSGDLTRSLELLWGTRERPTRGPKPALTQHTVVTAAVALADRDGLAALSMRNVAAELGVGTMTLYRYVPGKGELLDLMIDHVNAPVDAAGYHGDWRTVLEQIAHESWELYTTHPWLLQVNQDRSILGPNALRSFDNALRALDGLGLCGQEKVAVLVAIDRYVTGAARSYVLQQRAAQESGMSDEEFWSAQEPFLARALETGEYGQIAALPEDTFSIRDEDVWDFGMRVMLDGFGLLFEARATPAPAAGGAPSPPLPETGLPRPDDSPGTGAPPPDPRSA